MKLFSLLSIILVSNLATAQDKFPNFLAGTWKMENGDTYEHWDKLSKTSLKGYSYEIKKGEIIVNEYLDLSKREDGIFYNPTVIGQNDGKGVDFKLTTSDSMYVFENPKHDFPKKIVYKKLSATEIYVQVLGANDKGFSYKMQKQKSTAASLKTEPVSKSDSIPNPNYDSELAVKLGGDDYGMKNYIFVILKTGENKTTDKAFIDSCFMGHMSNMGKLVEQEKLTVAGPFGKNDQNMRGLFILNVSTIEEAEILLQTDPAIKAKLLKPELYPWYGSAALPEYLEATEKIWRSKF